MSQDLFSSLFGQPKTNNNSFGSNSFGDVKTNNGKKGRSTVKSVYLSLEELFTGVTKKMRVTRDRLHNTTIVATTKDLELNIKPGWKHGTKITFEGEGDEAIGEAAGDVVFEVEEKRHDRFVRDGANLIYRQTVSVVEALVGTKFTLVGIDGKTIEVDTTGTVLGGGYEKVVANKGMPKSKAPGTFGHLRIQFDVRWPSSSLTPAQAKTLTQLNLR